MRRFLSTAALGLVMLAAPAAAAGNAPFFDLAAFFEGASRSVGEVRTLLVFREAFTATFAGRREGDRLRLDERFAFSDGHRLQRWDLTQGASDITGTVATELDDGSLGAPVPVTGRRTAAGAVLTYEGYAPGGGERLLGFRHEMTAQADGTVSNHVVVSKFGLPLAVSDVVFAKSADDLARHWPPR